jgi:hypothetical protein
MLPLLDASGGFASRDLVAPLWDARPVTSRDGRKFSYAEFGSFVRRFNQEALLAAVARRALKVPLYLPQQGSGLQGVRRDAALGARGGGESVNHTWQRLPVDRAAGAGRAESVPHARESR